MRDAGGNGARRSSLSSAQIGKAFKSRTTTGKTVITFPLYTVRGITLFPARLTVGPPPGRLSPPIMTGKGFWLYAVRPGVGQRR